MPTGASVFLRRAGAAGARDSRDQWTGAGTACGTANMCDVSGCSSEMGSGCVSDDGRDAMLDILEEFQRLYQDRMARLERHPASPSYNKVRLRD